MKVFLKILLMGVFFIGFSESKANTLLESLNSAYLNNSKLNAERASMRASREEKREAVSEFLPSVTVSGYDSEINNTHSLGEAGTSFRPSEQSILVEQKIFQGFGGIANLQKKRQGQKLAEFKLKKIEQEILLEAAKAHTELLLNTEKVNTKLFRVYNDSSNIVNVDYIAIQNNTIIKNISIDSDKIQLINNIIDRTLA